MATVLEEFITQEQRSVVQFLWAKGLSAKDIHKEMFPVYGGKCFSCKAVENCVEKRGRRFVNDDEFDTETPKWLRQQSKNFRAAGFDAVVERWNKCISVGGGYVEKEMFLRGSNITCFTFYTHL
jgi:hypothetical protein